VTMRVVSLSVLALALLGGGRSLSPVVLRAGCGLQGRVNGLRGLALPPLGATIDSPAIEEGEWSSVRSELLARAKACKGGFEASREDRKAMEDLIQRVAVWNPTRQPAAAYYAEPAAAGGPEEASLSGEWTLAYTDAPDIISLDQNPLSEVARIGQVCDSSAGTIANVIEWRPRSWLRGQPAASFLEKDLVEQRVVLRAQADPAQPSRVDLFVEGLDLIPRTVLGNPLVGRQLQLRGPLSGRIPFGSFDVLYLDEALRITRTYQGYYAVNVKRDRDAEETQGEM